jgi:DNA-directed RNA polymerase specialized sigma24 family protein
MDSHRARARRPVPAATVPEHATAPAEAAVPELWAKVDGLPPKQREAVLRRYVGDLPYADIAVAMDCSPDAARRSVFEGIKKLREVWDD